MGIYTYNEIKLKEREIEVKALVALLNTRHNVGPNTIDDCIKKLDRIAFPEDYVDDEVEFE